MASVMDNIRIEAQGIANDFDVLVEVKQNETHYTFTVIGKTILERVGEDGKKDYALIKKAKKTLPTESLISIARSNVLEYIVKLIRRQLAMTQTIFDRSVEEVKLSDTYLNEFLPLKKSILWRELQ